MFKKKKEKVAAAAPVEKISKGEWMQKYWRPCAAFMYMICCLADFAIFPIMFTVVQFWEQEAANDAFRQWVPITLQGGGLFHVSMCAVLGVSAYGRTQEKLNGASGTPAPAGLPSPTLSSAPPAGGSPSGFNSSPSSFATPSTPSSGFGAAPGGFGSPAAASSGFGGSGFGGAPMQVATTAGGKKIVPDAEQPLL